MHTDLLPPSEPIMPWSRLVEAGWHISHLHHARLAGQTSLVVVMRKGNDHLFEQGPDLPVIWKKLEVQAGIEKRQAAPKPEKAPADPRHAAFLDLWFKRHADFFGRPYSMNGGKDGSQLARFLKSMPKVTALEMMDVAERAWEKQEMDPFAKESKLATTIAGLVIGWNGICAELDRAKQASNGTPNRVRL